MKKVIDAAHLMRLVDERRSVLIVGRFPRQGPLPAAAIVNWQFRLVARLLADGALSVYEPVNTAPAWRKRANP